MRKYMNVVITSNSLKPIKTFFSNYLRTQYSNFGTYNRNFYCTISHAA